jgi:hypothetical protein
MNQYLISWFVNGRFTPCRSHVYCKWGKWWQANFGHYPNGAIRIVDI